MTLNPKNDKKLQIEEIFQIRWQKGTSNVRIS